jgi:phosphoribosylamine--glycine ligase
VNILLIGSGGREHALAWAISASPLATKLYCAPGNAGIAQVAECVPIDAMALDRLIAFAKETRIEFVVIGPEAPLTAGLADRFEAEGIKSFGPSAAGAQLEGSKGFVKDLCREHGIPTAAYQRFRFSQALRRLIAAPDRGESRRARARQGRDHRRDAGRIGECDRVDVRRRVRRRG